MSTVSTQPLLTQESAKKAGKYQRLVDRSDWLIKTYREKMNTELESGKSHEEIDKDRSLTEFLMEEDCIAHLFECEGIKTYEQIASYAKQLGVERVFDIGCAYGHQSEVFLQEGMEYVGINNGEHLFWNEDRFTFIAGKYPLPLDTKKGDLGVSVLCLTWNVYLFEKEKTLMEQCEALQRDFEHCLLYMQNDRVEFVSQYFKTVEKIGRNLYYFSNK